MPPGHSNPLSDELLAAYRTEIYRLEAKVAFFLSFRESLPSNSRLGKYFNHYRLRKNYIGDGWGFKLYFLQGSILLAISEFQELGISLLFIHNSSSVSILASGTCVTI